MIAISQLWLEIVLLLRLGLPIKVRGIIHLAILRIS